MVQTERGRRPYVRIEHLWPLLALCAVFTFTSTHPIRPNDFWWHLKAGQLIATSGRIPAVDTFSHTMAGTPYNNYAAFWLMEVFYYITYTAGGPALIVFTHSLLVTAAYAMLLHICRGVASSWRVAAAATFFAVVLGFNNWNVRPQAVSFPAGAAVLWAVYGYRARPRRWLLAVPPLALLVWVNSHGSFVVGLLVLGIWLADETAAAVSSRLAGRKGGSAARLLAPAGVFAASTLACLLNPRGPRALAYVAALSGNEVIRSMVPEWAAPTFGQWHGTLFLAALLSTAVLLAVSPRRPGFFHLSAYVAFGALALSSSRGIVWFGIAMAPVVAEHLAALAGATRRSPRTEAAGHGLPALNYLFATLMLAAAVLSLPWLKGLLPLPEKKAGLVFSETPVAATEFLLDRRLPLPIFNEQAFGSYLIWAAQPQYPVFIDTRLELYPLAIWQDYLAISAGREGWQGLLDRYGVKTLMLSPSSQAGLIAALRNSADWQMVYEDRAATIYVRAGATTNSQPHRTSQAGSPPHSSTRPSARTSTTSGSP
jgi:hypothetical protein